MAKQHILFLTEWQSASGYWYCADVSDVRGISFSYWAIVRMLNITPAAFAELLTKKFNVSHMSYSKEKDVLTYCWKSQADMRKFKNWVNAQARKVQFYC